MKAEDFFLLHGKINDILLILKTYIKDPAVRNSPVTHKSYLVKIASLQECSDGLVALCAHAYEHLPPTDQQRADILSYEFDFEELQGAQGSINQAEEYIRKCSDARENYINSELVDTIKAAFHVRYGIFQLVNSERAFVEKCRSIDIKRFRMIFQRYLPGGQVPIIPLLEDESVAFIADAMSILEIYPAIENNLKMDIAAINDFVAHPLPGINFVYEKITSDEFVEALDNKLGKISQNWNALDLIRKELFERISREWDSCFLLLQSESSELVREERLELAKFLEEPALDPMNNETYLDFLGKIQNRIGPVRFEDLESKFYNIYFTQRDKEELKIMDRVFSTPWARSMRYKETLEQLVKNDRFLSIKQFLERHIADHEDPGLQRMQEATQQIEEVLKLLDDKARAFVQSDLDEQSIARNKAVTENEKRILQKKVILRTIEDLDKSAQAQAKKSFWNSPYNYKSAAAKRSYAEEWRSKLMAYNNKFPETPEMDEAGPLAGEVEETFEQAMERIEKESLAILNDKDRELVFTGSTNNTGAIKKDFFKKVKEISKLERRSSVFELRARDPRPQGQQAQAQEQENAKRPDNQHAPIF